MGNRYGSELIEALVNLRPKKQLVEEEAKKRMVERHGDMLVDGTIAEEAINVMHNEERANILRTELLAIRKKQIEVSPFVRQAQKAANEEAKQAQRERDYERRWFDAERNTAEAQRKAQAKDATEVPPASAFRDAARGMVGQMAVRDIRPHGYLLAERKATKAAFAAMAKGDFVEAATQKQRELLNHYLYREATNALETADDIYAYARKFTKTRTRQKFGKAGGPYLEQIDDLLEQYEFADVPKGNLIRRENLLQFVRDRMEDDEPVMIPDAVLVGTQKATIKAMTDRNAENAKLIKQQAEDAKKASQDHEQENKVIRRRALADARRRVPIDRATFCGSPGAAEASPARRDEQADTGTAFLPDAFASDLRQLAADADEVAADLRALKARSAGCFE